MYKVQWLIHTYILLNMVSLSGLLYYRPEAFSQLWVNYSSDEKQVGDRGHPPPPPHGLSTQLSIYPTVNS